MLRAGTGGGARLTSIAALVAASVTGGCLGQGPPQRISGPAAAAADVVDALSNATADGDFETICRRLFSHKLRRQTGGADCPRQLARTSEGVRDPRLEIEAIDVGRHAATVRVGTYARGQQRIPETIELERDPEGAFRVAGLGD